MLCTGGWLLATRGRQLISSYLHQKAGVFCSDRMLTIMSGSSLRLDSNACVTYNYSMKLCLSGDAMLACFWLCWHCDAHWCRELGFATRNMSDRHKAHVCCFLSKCLNRQICRLTINISQDYTYQACQHMNLHLLCQNRCGLTHIAYSNKVVLRCSCIAQWRVS